MMGTAKQEVKTSVVSPPRHSEAFKRDAVRLVTEEGYTFAAATHAALWIRSPDGRQEKVLSCRARRPPSLTSIAGSI